MRKRESTERDTGRSILTLHSLAETGACLVVKDAVHVPPHRVLVGQGAAELVKVLGEERLVEDAHPSRHRPKGLAILLGRALQRVNSFDRRCCRTQDHRQTDGSHNKLHGDGE